MAKKRKTTAAPATYYVECHQKDGTKKRSSSGLSKREADVLAKDLSKKFSSNVYAVRREGAPSKAPAKRKR